MPSEIASGAEQIDNAAHEIARPLVEAVEEFKRHGTPDNRAKMYAEVRKLKGE